MSTAFLALSNAIQSALLAAPALAGGRVWKNRLRPLAATHDSAVVVRMEGSTGQEVVLGMTDWSSSFGIECYGRGVAGADPADAVDTLLQEVWARLAVLNLAALVSMGVVVEPEIIWQYDEAETSLVCAMFRLQVQHRTPFASLSA